MERHLTPDDARGAASSEHGHSAQLARVFSLEVRARNVARARRLVSDALAEGVSPGRLYVEVVRPSLDALVIDGEARQSRVLAGLGRALVADLVGALPVSAGGGAGRAALLSCGESTIERLDGDVVADFLEADGWAVHRFRGPQASRSLSTASRADGVELAVAVVAGPEEALRLAPACTDMHRLPDPPVCLLCDFTGRADWPAASTALGADAFISDPQELLAQAAKRLPAGEARRWGVSIARRGEALVLTPTGMLDGTSAGRLVEVVQSRMGSFSTLVVDLRDLAEISPSGIQAIGEWNHGPLQDVPLQLVGDAGVGSRIAALGLSVQLADGAPI